ncbi:hypothetical protein SC206_14415 [Rouxiella sp. T17]|uniref:hypothetical protein n=1 Tax=Rouxiella sp. T17 TaxID=3085684 RepID=UPI002FC64C39
MDALINAKENMPLSYTSKNKKSEIFNNKIAVNFKQANINPLPLNFRSDPFSQAILLLYIQGSLQVNLSNNRLTVCNSAEKPSSSTHPAEHIVSQKNINTFYEIKEIPLPALPTFANLNKFMINQADSTLSAIGSSLRKWVAESKSNSAMINGVGATPLKPIKTYHRSILEFFIKYPTSETINNDVPHLVKAEPIEVETEDLLIAPLPLDLSADAVATESIIKYFGDSEECSKCEIIADKTIEHASNVYKEILTAIDHPTLHIDTWLEKQIFDIVVVEGGDPLLINGSLAINTFLPPESIEVGRNRLRQVNDYSLKKIITKEYRRGQYANILLDFKWPPFITASMTDKFLSADIENKYTTELDHHLSSNSVSENLKQYFTINWQARVNDYITNNDFIYNANEIENIKEYIRMQKNPRVVYWDNLPVGNVFMIPSYEKVITEPSDVQIETHGIIFSTTDKRVFKVTSNGNVVSGASPEELSSFIAKHLPYKEQETFEPLIKISEEIGKNLRFTVDAFDTVRNTPRITFNSCGDLGRLHYQLFIENLKSDIDYISKSDEELHWDSVLETIDMIGTTISIAAIPLTLGTSSHFAIARLTHAASNLILTSITTVVPKLIQAHLADRPIEARKHLTDAILALSSEGIGLIIGKTLKTLPTLQSISYLIPKPIKMKIERLVQKKLATKFNNVNQLNIGANVALPFIDRYASKNLPQQTTLLIENLAAKRRSYEAMLVKKARKTSRRNEERFYLISKEQLLKEWLPNTFYNVISNLWGKTALSKWINNDANLNTAELGKKFTLTLNNNLENQKPLYFIGTDLRGMTLNKTLTLTDFQHSDNLLQQGLIQSYNASQISSALNQAEDCAHWSPKLETLRHEELKLIADHVHTYINNSALAPETNLPLLLDNSQRLIDRFHLGIIGKDARTHDDLHIPLIVVTDKAADSRQQGAEKISVHSDVFALENIRAIISPEDVVEQVAALLRQQTNTSLPFYSFSIDNQKQLSLSPFCVTATT